MTSTRRPQPMFTIEQVELIRRLRNSGLTHEQLLQAFDSLERIDSELGNLYTVPVSLSQAKSFTTATAQANSSHAFHQRSTVPTQPGHTVELPPTAHSNNSVTSSSSQHVNRRFQGVRRVRDVSNDSEDGVEEYSDGSTMSALPVNTFDAHPGTKPLALRVDNPLTQEVEAFLKKGSEKMHEEIKEFFFANPHFTHSEIALAAGVSVTCVSKFLVGNFISLSHMVLRRLAQWFLATRNQHQNVQLQQQCNNSTSRMLRDVVQERLNGGLSDGGTCHSIGVSGDGQALEDKLVDGLSAGGGMYTGMGISEGLDVHFTPRRERFTFRKQHLEILEACFKTNQYPTYEERNDIACRCNSSMESTTGRALGEKERMTAQNVAYWFSNRRKDIKRLAREGGIDMSEVILPSRVRRSPTPSFYDISIPYFPLDLPSVGPVAFPVTSSLARTAADSLSGDIGNMSSDSQSSDLVTVKQEPPDDTVLMPATGVARTSGAAVERIAAEISSQLLSSGGKSRARVHTKDRTPSLAVSVRQQDEVVSVRQQDEVAPVRQQDEVALQEEPPPSTTEDHGDSTGSDTSNETGVENGSIDANTSSLAEMKCEDMQ